MRNRLFLIPVAVLLMSISAESYAFNPIKPFKVNASVHVGAGALSNAADRVCDGYLRGFFYSDGGPKVEALYSERVNVTDGLALSARIEAHLSTVFLSVRTSGGPGSVRTSIRD